MEKQKNELQHIWDTDIKEQKNQWVKVWDLCSAGDQTRWQIVPSDLKDNELKLFVKNVHVSTIGQNFFSSSHVLLPFDLLRGCIQHHFIYQQQQVLANEN